MKTSSFNFRGMQRILSALAALLALTITALSQTPGTIDTSFNGQSFMATFKDPFGGTNPDYRVYGAERASDGKIYLRGRIDGMSGHVSRTLVRLHPDGNVDKSFVAFRGSSIHTNVMETVFSKPLSDGKIIVGWFGRFARADVPLLADIKYELTRLNSDGSVDPMFNPEITYIESPLAAGPTTELALRDAAILEDGSILLTGWMGIVRQDPNRLVRLLPDGRADTGFSPFISNGINLTQIGIFSDGRILLKAIDGFDLSEWLIRLASDGGEDSTFAWPFANVTSLADFAIQADDRILVATSPQLPASTVPALSGLIRLNPDGSLDESFKPDAVVKTGVSNIALQRDGKIVLAVVAPETYNHFLYRLMPDGSLDPSFSVNIDFRGKLIRSVTVLPDGQILLAGTFSLSSPSKYDGVLRLHGRGDRILPKPILKQGKVHVSIPTQPGTSYFLESAADAAAQSWTTVASVEGNGLNREIIDPIDSSAKIYRVRLEDFTLP